MKPAPILGLAVLMLLAAATVPPAANAQTPKHNCAWCHDLHGGSYAALGTHATSQALCESCHGDTGPAFVDRDGVQVAVPKDVPVHTGSKHSSPTSCWACHDHEGESTGNLKMIPTSRTGTAGGVTRPVVFTALTGTKSYADGDATYDGVCEVCHTQTTQHRFDGSVTKHNAAANCSACHRHSDGFRGSGRCTSCHATAQGARRAVLGEFSRLSHHVQWQAAGLPVADSIPDSDCTICHDQSQHQLGRVRLWNVDAPGNTTSAVELTGDPNTVSAEAAKLEVACLSCHDGNGASGDVTPFTDNLIRPLVDSGLWVASSHSTSAGVPAGCYGDGTTGCHALSHGSNKRKLLAPASAAATAPDYATEQEGFCYVCHDGSPAAKNLQAEMLKGTNTATLIYHHPVVNSQQPSGRPVECSSCHNPHVAKPDGTAPTPPAASTRLKGVTRVAVTNGAAGTVPTYTLRAATDTTGAKEYEVCFKCHSSYIPVPTGKTNMAVVLNPANPSYHPVEAQGKNLNINANAFTGGWTATRTTRCTDCHTSNNTAVVGPHGSTNRYILRQPYTASSSTRTMASTENCFQCHAFATYANNSSTNTIKGYSRFNPPTFADGHTYHVGSKRYPCYACHTTHGSATQAGLIVTGRSPGLTSYTRTANGGTCTTSCHPWGNETQTYTINYAR